MTPPQDITLAPLNRILLVDDDAVTNMMHRRVIERSGRAHAIDVATDGAEALDLLRADLAQGRFLPELIFLDINMPGMGGFEFLEHYAKLHIGADAQLIIVMLSTSLLPADHRRAEADPNVHSFCDKPLRLEKLLELVEAFQSRARAGRSAA
jgi:CheY-like chemotaxis protein